MGKTYYNKEDKQYQRSIKINGVSILIGYPDKEYLDKLPYRLNTDIIIENGK